MKIINNKIHFSLAVTPLLFFIVSQNIHICICLMLLLRRLLLLLLLSLLFFCYYCCSLLLLRPQLLHNNKVPWLGYGIVICLPLLFCFIIMRNWNELSRRAHDGKCVRLYGVVVVVVVVWLMVFVVVVVVAYFVSCARLCVCVLFISIHENCSVMKFLFVFR